MGQTLAAKPSEIIDLNNCEAIQNGAKEKREVETMDDFLKLR